MNCSRNRSVVAVFVVGFVTVAVAANAAFAGVPKIRSLSHRGLQIGATMRLGMAGSDFTPDMRLVLGVPIKSQKIVGKPAADRVVIEVELDAATPPGIAVLRVQTAGGVSSPELVTLDGLPQKNIPAAATPESEKPHSLPVAVHGLVAGAAVQEAKFLGRKGQAITVDLLAKRFGSKLRPVVHLYDAARKQLAWSLPQSALAGDARCSATLPADGEYVVAVHDLTYAAAAGSYFRVAIGEFDYADVAYPPTVAAGSSQPIELIGRFGDAPTKQLAATSVAATLAKANPGDDRPLPWPAKVAAVGLRPHVSISNLSEHTEEQLAKQERVLPSPPVAVSGRLLQAGESDVYRLALAAGEKIRVELFADRLGSPLDGVVELQNEKGARLAQADDVVGPDPRLDYAAPKTASEVKIVVTDSLGRGDARNVYRLVVTRIDSAAAEKSSETALSPTDDFRLTFVDDTHNLSTDGTKVFRVVVERSGYEGPIRLSVAGLPGGFSTLPVEVPAGGDGGLVEIRRTGTAASDAVGQITIRGESVGAKPPLVRTAEVAGHPLARLQPWLKYEAVVAATETPSPLAVDWADDSAEASQLIVGTVGKLAVRVQRDPATADKEKDAGAKIGGMRLSLVTSQAPPSSDLQAAQAQAMTLRGVAATVDLKPVPAAKAASAKGQSAKNKAAAKSEPAVDAAQSGEFPVQIPLDLKSPAYDLAIRAELLSADGKSTVAEAFTPPRRFAVQAPVKLLLDAPATGPIALDAKQGATVAYAGSIERLQGFAGDATVTLVGLPTGVTAPSVVLKPKADKFKLEVKLPPNLKATELAGVKLTASLVADTRRNAATLKIETALPDRPIQSSTAADKKKR